MSNIVKTTKSRTSRFFRRENGSATVEAVLWLPVFFAFFGLMADAAFLFNGQAYALRVVQDANRFASIGRFTTTDQTSEFIEETLQSISPNAVASTRFKDGLISSMVSMPATDLSQIGFFKVLREMKVNVVAHHMAEK